MKDDRLWPEKIKPNIQIEGEADAPVSDENSDESVQPQLTGMKSKRIQQKIFDQFNEEELSDESAQFDYNAFSAGDTIHVNVQEQFLEHMMSIFPKHFPSSREGVPYDKRIGSLIGAFSKNRQKKDLTIKYWISDFESSIKMNLRLPGKGNFLGVFFH